MNWRERLLLIGPIVFWIVGWLGRLFGWGLFPEDTVQVAVVVPLFLGLTYGPAVGFVAGYLGDLLIHLTTGTPPGIHTGVPALDVLAIVADPEQLGFGLMGLVAGLATIGHRRYASPSELLRPQAAAFLAILVGNAFTWLARARIVGAAAVMLLGSHYVPLAGVDLILAMIMLPVLLYNHAHFTMRLSEWRTSALMHRLGALVLVSGALPAFLMVLLLRSQIAGPYNDLGSFFELWRTVSFTVWIALFFTFVNGAIMAQTLTRPVMRVTEAALAMHDGTLTPEQAAELKSMTGSDELSNLGRVFGHMAEEVIGREQALRQQVAALQIKIDDAKKAAEVAEVTETDYFHDLQQRAARIRTGARPAPSSTEKTASA